MKNIFYHTENNSRTLNPNFPNTSTTLARYCFLGWVVVMLGDNIDWNLYEETIIPLRPRCELTRVRYPTHVTSVRAIVTPYKKYTAQIGTPYDGYYSPGGWYSFNSGPKYDLDEGARLTWLYYQLKLATAGSENILCRDIAIDSAIALFALCKLKQILDDQDEYNRCIQRVITEYVNDLDTCKKEYERNLEKAMSEATADLDAYIEAYGGCTALNGLIENWEDYWAGLIRK